MKIYQRHISCLPDGLSCYPYLAHGIVILFATALSMILVERFLLWTGRNVFGYPTVRFPVRNFGLIFCLVSPIAVYPAVSMLLTEPTSFFDFSTAIFTAPRSSAYVGLAAALATTAFSTIILASLVANNRRRYGVFALVASMTLILFYFFFYVDVFVSGSSARRIVCHAERLQACLSYLERGVLLSFAFICSTIMVERVIRNFGQSAIYQDTM